MNSCVLCPRNCHADRDAGKTGYCRVAGPGVKVTRIALHMWEEPCISGQEGSGTVFFLGCPLRCIYCQNYDIANVNGDTAQHWEPISIDLLGKRFVELQEMGANNINLVTPTHYTPEIIEALRPIKNRELHIPVVYNCSGYEKAETLKRLEGLIDVYLTDYKYQDPILAEKFSHAPDYPEIAAAALQEMVRQTGDPCYDNAGMLQKGVIVRHLLLPGHVKNAESVIKYVFETYGDSVILSIMNQYTPPCEFGKNLLEYPELNRRVTEREYEKLLDYVLDLGIENAYIQEGATAETSFIPQFDGEGVF